jgi:hypothetical protein
MLLDEPGIASINHQAHTNESKTGRTITTEGHPSSEAESFNSSPYRPLCPILPFADNSNQPQIARSVDESNGRNAAIPETSEVAMGAPKSSPEENSSYQSTKANADDPRRVTTSDLIPLQPNQTVHLPFPMGCKVWWGLESANEEQTFQHGTVVQVHFNFTTRVILYEAMSCNEENHENLNRSLLFEEELAYAPKTPIFYSSSGLLEDKTVRRSGEILYCRTNPCGDLDKVQSISESLKHEHSQMKSNGNNSESIERIRVFLLKLDSEVSINRFILKETGIGRTIKSISKLLAKRNDTGSVLATELIEKWRSQISRPQLYYTIMLFDENHEIQMIEDVPSSCIKLRN